MLSMTEARPPPYMGYRYGLLAICYKETAKRGDGMKQTSDLNNLNIYLEKYDLPKPMLLLQVNFLFFYFKKILDNNFIDVK